LDAGDKTSITGWAVDESRPYTRVEVQLFIDDRFAATTAADQFRRDVHEARRAEDDWHGFVFATPRLSAGKHEARVYAVHSNSSGARKTLQLIGKPYRFSVELSVHTEKVSLESDGSNQIERVRGRGHNYRSLAGGLGNRFNCFLGANCRMDSFGLRSSAHT